MSDRCEPPEELRGVDGWHWVQGQYSTGPMLWIAHPKCGFWQGAGDDGFQLAAEHAHADGLRYVAPATPPAEVAALRAEVERLRGAEAYQSEAHTLRTGQKMLADLVRSWGYDNQRQESNGQLIRRVLDDQRANVAELMEALEGMLTWVEQRPTPHPYDTWKAAEATLARVRGAG